MDRLIPDLPEFAPGSVWLAGAGPGDPGLLTVHALAALGAAEVVIYDALVSKGILRLANPGAAHEFAGKRGGRPSARQGDISARLIELARQDKRVLRLKGGDPFIFGRGAEEAAALSAAGVPFRIVPGISAGIGGLAYAGIPLTHRDTNAAVAFVTGHTSAGHGPDSVDWAALARGAPVLVVYMPLRNLAAIADSLLAAGRGGEEPVAIVCNASLPDQLVIETTLGACAEEAAAQGATPPALVVVGEVVGMRGSLDWFIAPAAAHT